MRRTNLVMRTSCDERRVETCDVVFVDGRILFESVDELRPSFRVERDGSVTLLPHGTDHEIEGFGEFVGLEDGVE